jgi:hypothetical protein
MSDVAHRAEPPGPQPPARRASRGVRVLDGGSLGPPGSSTKVIIRSPLALRRLLWSVVTAMQEHRDVEFLREHYTRALRSWVANLESHWDEVVEEVGSARARIWRLYMAGSALSSRPAASTSIRSWA